MDNIGLIPPHDEDVEKAVLGAMILDKDALLYGKSRLKTKDFYKQQNGEIFNAIVYVSNKSEVDLITLSNALKKNGLLEKLGGFSYLTDITQLGIITTNIEHWVKIVKEKRAMRQALKFSSKIAELAQKDDMQEMVDFVHEYAYKIGYSETGAIQHISEITPVVYQSMEDESTGKLQYVDTGYTDLDKHVKIRPGDVIILAGRPSMGKTALALNIFDRITLKKPAVFFSLEMSKESLVSRMALSNAHISTYDIRKGPEHVAWGDLAKTMGKLGNRKAYIEDTGCYTIGEIRAKARKLKMKLQEKGEDLCAIFIDYLQLMSTDSKKSREQGIAEVSRQCKQMGKELKCPVFCIAQLSRACEMRADHRPMLSDLRESGQIEQDWTNSKGLAYYIVVCYNCPKE